jgi:soluble lytic murein transglycosylase-like protein
MEGRSMPSVGCRGLAVLAALIAAAGVARAERVVFDDLRILQVERVECVGATCVLHLPGDGRIHVEARRIREIREDRKPALPAEAAAEPTWKTLAGPFVASVERAAREYGVSPALLVAMMRVESAFDPQAVSPKGAVGLMQLMPATADLMSVEDPTDPAQNIDGGARWLRQMLDRFEGDLDLALAAYNAGPETVSRYGGIPPYRETQRYVRAVRRHFERMSGPGGDDA